MEPICPVCREDEMVIIQLDVSSHEVTLLSCSACGSKWWTRDGVRTEIADVIELASATAKPNTKGRRRKVTTA